MERDLAYNIACFAGSLGLVGCGSGGGGGGGSGNIRDNGNRIFSGIYTGTVRCLSEGSGLLEGNNSYDKYREMTISTSGLPVYNGRDAKPGNFLDLDFTNADARLNISGVSRPDFGQGSAAVRVIFNASVSGVEDGTEMRMDISGSEQVSQSMVLLDELYYDSQLDISGSVRSQGSFTGREICTGNLFID